MASNLSTDAAMLQSLWDLVLSWFGQLQVLKTRTATSFIGGSCFDAFCATPLVVNGNSTTWDTGPQFMEQIILVKAAVC